MKSRIIDELRNIEVGYDVNVLYACESGSRAWGFDNEESDYDVRFIYRKNSLKNYLTLSEKNDDVIDYMDGDLDIVGWDVRKALYLHRKSNPNLREWIASPLKYIDWKEDVFTNLPDFDSGVLKYHYASIAMNNWKRLNFQDFELSKRNIKMYLYNCRCILSWSVIDRGDSPSINIFDLLNQVNDLDGQTMDDLYNIINYYRNGCRDDFDLEMLKRLNQWMDYNLTVIKSDRPKKEDFPDMKLYEERFFDIVFPDFDDYCRWAKKH